MKTWKKSHIFFLIDRKTTTKRVFRGSGGLVVSTESSRLGIDLCKFCYDLNVSYKNVEARFLKTTFFKLACRITQKVFDRFIQNKQGYWIKKIISLILDKNYGRYPARRSTTPVARHLSPPWITPPLWKNVTWFFFAMFFRNSLK